MSQYPLRQVGTETLDPNKAQCGLWDWCRNSEAALFNVSTNPGVYSHRGLIARTTFRDAGYHNGGLGSLQIDASKPYFVVTAAGASPASGMQVQKMGHVTGWTWGTVSNTCVDHFFNQGGLVDYVTKCNYEANINHNSGDSGGPFFLWDGADEVTLLGTLVGQTVTTNGIYSPYTRIVGELGGTFVATRGVNLSTPTGLTTSITNGHPALSWSAVSGATRYNMFFQHYEFAGYDEYSNPIYNLTMPEYAGTVTSASFTDNTQNVVPGSCAYWDEIYYYLKAASNTDVSPPSTVVWFCK
jgi:hypothetical protein